MTVKRMDNVGIVVEDLDGAVEFFTELGLTLEGRMPIEGEWAGRVTGVRGQRVEIAMMRTPDGHSRVELSRFNVPVIASDHRAAPVNSLGYLRVMFTVEDIEDTLARLSKLGGTVVDEVVNYEDIYRLCYIRGPEGILIGLAQQLGQQTSRVNPVGRLRVIDTAKSTPRTYRELAALRASSAPNGFLQPESCGYDFRDWISPYTKGACKTHGIAVVLQDWASESGLIGHHDPRIATLGRDPDRITNRRLEALLRSVLETSLSDIYATNVFPFVKPGGMSASIPQKLVNQTAKMFTAPELALANPTMVLALGKVAQRALQSAQVQCINLPHPAARRLDLAGQERIWRRALRRS